MAYHDELLQQSDELIHKDNANQADLRRSVSAAYYAVFHLLISETVSNWSRDSSRNGLARMFEHRVMAKASERVISAAFPFSGEDPLVVAKLRAVAHAFGQLQDKRHTADYDTASNWTHAQAMSVVQIAHTAFADWHAIKNEKIAQDYLVSLLIRPRS